MLFISVTVSSDIISNLTKAIQKADTFTIQEKLVEHIEKTTISCHRGKMETKLSLKQGLQQVNIVTYYTEIKLAFRAIRSTKYLR